MASRTKWVADALQRYQRIFGFSFSVATNPDFSSPEFGKVSVLDDPGGAVESVTFDYYGSAFHVVLTEGFVSMPGLSPEVHTDSLVGSFPDGQFIAMASNPDVTGREFDITLNTPIGSVSGFLNGTLYLASIGYYSGEGAIDNMAVSVLILGNDSDQPVRTSP